MLQEQTNRTILFEELNPNKPNIVTMTGDVSNQESLSDATLQEIHNFLEVHSFAELVEKLEPTVYILWNLDQKRLKLQREIPDGMQVLDFDTVPVPLSQEHSLLSVLLDFIHSKKNRQYLLKNLSTLLNSLVDDSEKENFIKTRKKIITNVQQKNITNAKNLMTQLVQKGGTSLMLVTLFLEEAYALLLSTETPNTKDRFINDLVTSNQVIPIGISDDLRNRVRSFSNEEYSIYRNLLSEVLAENSSRGICCHKELWEQWMCVPILRDREEIMELQKLYEVYLSQYTEMIRAFWSQTKPLLETLLGVRLYFEQYQKVEAGMSPTLVITNMVPEDMNTPLYLRRLQVYLETVNEKNDGKNTLWYAIIPRIEIEDKEKKKEIRERFQGRGEEEKATAFQAEDVAAVSALVMEYRIQVFFSPYVTEKTCYPWVREHGIDSFMEALSWYSRMEHLEYMIPCFPNCTVIPKENARIVLGKKTLMDELEERIVVQGEQKLWLDGIGVSAAYVVAGLYAACQCPAYLKKIYKKNVDEELPGVAYQMLVDTHREKTCTTLAREILDFPEEIAKTVELRYPGVFLMPSKGRTTICVDRTLSFQKGRKDRVWNVQTLTYIQRVIRYITQDYKENLIKQFFENRAGNLMMHWTQERKSVNAILKEQETIAYRIDEKNSTCTFTVKFQETEKGETVRIAR